MIVIVARWNNQGFLFGAFLVIGLCWISIEKYGNPTHKATGHLKTQAQLDVIQGDYPIYPFGILAVSQSSKHSLVLECFRLLDLNFSPIIRTSKSDIEIENCCEVGISYMWYPFSSPVLYTECVTSQNPYFEGLFPNVMVFEVQDLWIFIIMNIY